MTPKRRIGLAASVVAIAGAFGALPATAQTQPASSSGGATSETVTDERLNEVREENARLAEYVAQLERRTALEAELFERQAAQTEARHELRQRALDQRLQRMSEEQRRDYERERERLTDTIETERLRAQDRRELSRATERHGRNAFFSRTTAGMPGECNPRTAAIPDLEADPQSLHDVLGNVQQCYFAFAERGEPFTNRRAAYSTAAGFGALGGAIGGEAIAASTAAAWGGLVLLPIIIEGSVDRPEFDSLDRVTARGLNWVNGRAVQMNAIQRRLGNEANALQLQITEFNAAGSEADRGVLQRLIEAAGKEDASADDEIAAAAAQSIQVSIGEILREARNTRGDLLGAEEHIRDLLPTWAQMRFNRVMDNYSSHRRDMTLRPQAAARSIVALPFSSLANFIRGDDDKVRAQVYFSSTVAATLRDLHSPIRMPTLRSRDVAAINDLDLTRFPEADRNAVRDMVEGANRVQEEIVHARALLDHARAVDEQGAPLFDEVGAVAAQNEAAAGESQRAASETPPTQPQTETPAAPAGDAPAPAGNSGGEAPAPTDPAPAGEDGDGD